MIPVWCFNFITVRPAAPAFPTVLPSRSAQGYALQAIPATRRALPTVATTYTGKSTDPRPTTPSPPTLTQHIPNLSSSNGASYETQNNYFLRTRPCPGDSSYRFRPDDAPTPR